MATQHCSNLNHRRSNAPVRGCPACGKVVNESVRATRCREEEHASQKKNGSLFCTGCGTRLRAA